MFSPAKMPFTRIKATTQQRLLFHAEPLEVQLAYENQFAHLPLEGAPCWITEYRLAGALPRSPCGPIAFTAT
jgi:hypothetical protein